MNTFKLTVTSPDGNSFSGEAEMLIVRGVEGELAVMAGHVPFVTAIVPCTVRIITGEDEITAKVGGGMLSVSKDETLLLSSSYQQE